MRTLLIAASFAAGLGAMALAQDSATNAPRDAVPTRGERQIEWPVGIQSMRDAGAAVFPEGAASRFAGAPIPVLAPTKLDAEQRQAYLDSFRSVKDGFFAVVPGATYDVVVNGTKSYAVAPASAGFEERDTRNYLFEPAENGANVSFQRFGVDFLLQFECKAAVGEGTCVTENEAKGFADNLTVVGGGGR